MVRRPPPPPPSPPEAEAPQQWATQTGESKAELRFDNAAAKDADGDDMDALGDAIGGMAGGAPMASAPDFESSANVKSSSAPSSGSSFGPPSLSKGAKEIYARGRFGKSKKKKPAKTGKAGKKKRALRESMLLDARKGERQQSGQETLLAAARELSTGNPARALPLFEQAERLGKGDARAGVTAVVGQMRSLEEMRRFGDALKRMPKILRSKPGTPGRIDGLLLGARCAENAGDFNQARKYLRMLMKVRGEGKAASEALKRLDEREAAKKMRRAAESDSAAGADEPAAQAR